MGRAQDAVEYFRNALNLSLEQASGIVGNLIGESNLNPNAVGDGGKAYGLAQWHPDRQANFKSLFGIDIRNGTFEQQLEFLTWELQNTERKAYERLLGAGTIAEATQSFMKWFERPAAWAQAQSLPKRVAAAEQAAVGKGELGSIDAGNFGDSISNALTPTWMQDLLNGKTAARWSAVVIGIILIGLAIGAFVFAKSDDIKKAVIEAAI